MKRDRYRKTQRIAVLAALVLTLAAALSGCSSSSNAPAEKVLSKELEKTGSMELEYAEQFAVDTYGEFSLVTINNEDRFLVVPEGKEAPADLDKDVAVLKQPINNIYLVSSAVMDMFIAMDDLESIAFTNLEEDSWYLEEAKQAMRDGTIRYAGKYNAPDYEQIMAGNCGLAVENTMIFHTPEIREQLVKFGIPVMVDYSSYENSPLGRMEWVKLYGLLTGHEDRAAAAFDAQKQRFEEISDGENTGKTVVYFYITQSGQASVRKASDYMAKMINLAGGEYIYSDLGDEEDTANATMNMSMEEFYATAKEADYIIYNATIDGQLSDKTDLLKKSELLKNFKAYQEGNVFCTAKNIYQSSMELGSIIADLHYMLTGEPEKMEYIYKLQ